MVQQREADQPAQQTTEALPNILALPSQTTILVTMLVGVIYGSVIAIVMATGSPLLDVMVPGLLVLSIRLWMAWPEREQRVLRPVPGYRECPKIQVRIAELACCLQIKRIPQLMLTDKPGTLGIYGGWLRWFMVIDRRRAQVMEDALDDPERAPFVDAILIHELHHFRLRDHRIIEYARALLRTSGSFIGWLELFGIGSIVVLVLSAQRVLQESLDQILARFDSIMPGVRIGEFMRPLLPPATEWAAMQEAVRTTNLPLVGFAVWLNTIPLVLFGGLLSLFLWRKLSRLRELYADAGVAQTQGTIQYLLYAPLVVGSTTVVADPSPAPLSWYNWRRYTAALRRWLLRRHSSLPAWVRGGAAGPGRGLLALTSRLRRWLDPTPAPHQRRLSLQDPRYVYDSRRATITLIALFVVVLEILLTNASALFYAALWPMHFPTLALFILVSLALVVAQVIGRDVWRERRVMVLSLLALRSLLFLGVIALLATHLVLDPQRLSLMFNVHIRIVGDFYQNGPGDLIGDLNAIMIELVIKNLAQLPVVGLLVWLGVGLVVRIAQRVLTWYSFPAQGWLWHDDAKPARRWYHLDPARRLLYVIYATIALLAATIALAVLPLLTDLVLWRWQALVMPARWLAVLLMLPLLAGGGLWLWRQDQRYGRCCPACGEAVPGVYWLGRRCDTCAALLNPWLVARYSSEVRE